MDGRGHKMTTLLGVDKAAILLMSLDKTNMQSILQAISKDELKKISQSMINLETIDHVQQQQILVDALSYIENGNVLCNKRDIENLLRDNFDSNTADEILLFAKKKDKTDIWEELENTDPTVVANYINSEPPHVAALLITKMNTESSINILQQITDEHVTKILYCMANNEVSENKLLKEVEKDIEHEIMDNLDSCTSSHNKVLAVANICSSIKKQRLDNIFQLMQTYDKNVINKIKKHMFTFDDIIKITDSGIQLIIRAADKSYLAIALKYTSKELCQYFLNNLPSRSAKILSEDIEMLENLEEKTINEAQTHITNVTKKLLDEGKIHKSSE